ncbi:uncharacterized protein LOC133785300 [Humulus lupulus]|uniref:uncharacterized protein LOC133785300 n=1 Tax=Humulus lupulus TaxID=3486 RepID=UPI002B413AB0|nr:uncharacterized protein LOC133785300 [Humulus lupulus]
MENNIREDIKNDNGIELSYGKAWRCRKKALTLVRGTLESSYQKLPSYFFMLQQKNPSTLTEFVTEDDRCYVQSLWMQITICIQMHFGIVDSENHESWTYFMSKLKEVIGEVDDLAFVFDRHANITHALDIIFPDAYHGACYHHISMNVIAEFKTDHCHKEMYNVTCAFRKSEFHTHFNKIKSKDPPIAQYLEGIGFDKWPQAYSLGKMRESSEKTTTTLALTYESDLVDMAEKDRFLIPYAVEFHVLDDELNGEVDLLNKTCTCDYYKIKTWRSSYIETIYPCGNKKEWIVPHDIKIMKVRTPAQKNLVGRPKKKQGRPKKKCHPSNGEKLIVERKCSTCGGRGHNGATCKVRV